MKQSDKKRLSLLIGVFITLITTLLMFLELSPFITLEAKLLDYRFKIRGKIDPPDSIVIAAIDEKSIERLGRWPWDRDRLAQLVRKLEEVHAGIIVFDIILSEEENNDKLLGDAIWDAGNVILPIVFDFEGKVGRPDNEYLNNTALASVTNEKLFRDYPPIIANGVLIPVPELISSVMTLGHINMFPDIDGTLRWESLLIGYRGKLYPSATLQAAASYLGIPNDKITVNATSGIQLGNKRYIPTDEYGRTLINYYGPNMTFTHISISDILEGNIKPEELRGKIILIGATAVGIYDLRVTPISAAMPGIEKHASVIASLIDGKHLKTIPSYVNLAILLSTGFLFSLIFTRLKAAGASVLTAASLLFISWAAYYMFAKYGLWVNVTYPALNIILTFVNATLYNYYIEERFAKKIRAMFSSYVTESLVNELIHNPELAKLGGENREVTILFSDIRGFTTFSEKHSPEEVVAILNEYLGEMTKIVLKWKGVLDKFIGDAILCFWGAPVRQDNHAELAIRCALEMMKRLGELQIKWAAEGKAGLDIGIGINTGKVIVGNIGAEGMKMDYTVIGDHVNLGSRVESLTRKYDAHILITEFTLESIRNLIKSGAIAHVSVEGKEKVIVKGKEKPVAVYEIHSLEHGCDSTVTECEKDEAVKLTEK
ncbi:MAG: adenylate/guanylate cyclase domain-containing protein [Thermodesulfovibrionia bacterium]|nr:adenylate/guanylate cyclase domain-containing protein [Thermodesulfovibrionia bacterium]